MNRKNHIRCPRCRYDLAGILNAWHDACPVHGICPECGQHLEWSRIIHPPPRPNWRADDRVSISLTRAVYTIASIIMIALITVASYALFRLL